MRWMIRPELIEKIKKKDEEKHRDVQIPLHVPEMPSYPEKEEEEEKSARVYIIDLVD
jgi:hypothetical protein